MTFISVILNNKINTVEQLIGYEFEGKLYNFIRRMFFAHITKVYRR